MREESTVLIRSAKEKYICNFRMLYLLNIIILIVDWFYNSITVALGVWNIYAVIIMVHDGVYLLILICLMYVVFIKFFAVIFSVISVLL